MESGIIFLPCRDLEASLAFYTDTVGLTLHRRDPAGCIWLDSGYGYLGLCRYDDGREMATGVCISFNLKDAAAVDAKYRELAARGDIEGLTKPQKHPRFGVYSFFFRDPNGYLVEFQRIV